ncbi:dehydroshikimate dehydratase [Rhodococcus sp. 05-2256-B2]|uniref:sugar phosphate isomerase/epimerase and 4-hydroxyphenylpyruvate domain-containing protein n=1 Tax=unclassified Rhodococcus (in: high G+C Gram-positive bacteria) TaxID=192944 RepID=UPI000B9AB2C0|nr:MULTISPECIES: sugar phosphate isomerase/epimerase and 4-hydroxyphenylpyruvate domain-containing protein [unclassified Rhodococcus (in: high G+C Gram-positive bacteria)]OZD77155.1 dehydroshikimate dehydratase [Rhodococcus sp. 05-2256-B4]OZD88274.1 dehydroshikimate dehydratase [Rhodococcus sp. 05-2256-B3]OZD98407.1 dehydroshikimate dehydratase [Rhodococcus sp. 05-2256-B2]OZE05385.1 dehydroshikimate dehydratase [Rhodococcus sp. 05-2256-B1]
MTAIATSVATVSLSGSLDEKMRAIAEAGFDGFEVFEPDLISSPDLPADIAKKAADLGLTVDLYQPFRDADSDDPDQFARNLVRAERKFDVMEQLGCDLLLVCSSPLAGAVREDDMLIEQMATLAERAHRRGLRLAYEALAWGSHVATYRHAWDIVRQVDHPALGTCLDSFHILSRGDDPSGIREIPGEKIFFVQLADAPHLVMDVLQWSRHHRCFPGQGNFDLATFGADVVASGYTGPWSLEIFNDVFRHSDTGRTASDAHRSLLHLQEQVRSVDTVVPNPDLFSLPPPGPIENIVSLRIAAGPAKAAQLGTTLRHLGFDLTAAHSEHGLSLFTQGPLAVAVDTTVDTLWTAPGVPAHLPALAQIGVRSERPDLWLTRARALGVPAATVTMPGVADATDAVVRLAVTGATSLDLRTRDSAGAWQSAFDLAPRVPVPQVKPLVSHVDHIALAVPAESWDGVMLLLRSVFGMVPRDGQDVVDAIGLVRSQALTLTTMNGTIRLSLNMVPGRPSDADPLPAARRGGVGHVAFGCEDIYAAAEAMTERGLTPLRISPNYYRDLNARFGLGQDTLDAMQRLGILYDADSAGGEFFHFFTGTVGDDLFFEVVQRVGGYEGYGETNSAVRLAAQLQQ